MSVRRLAEDQFQPVAFAFNAENTAWVRRRSRNIPRDVSNLPLSLLMRAQEQGRLGYPRRHRKNRRHA